MRYWSTWSTLLLLCLLAKCTSSKLTLSKDAPGGEDGIGRSESEESGGFTSRSGESKASITNAGVYSETTAKSSDGSKEESSLVNYEIFPMQTLHYAQPANFI
jgi:hypothetical protein